MKMKFLGSIFGWEISSSNFATKKTLSFEIEF